MHSSLRAESGAIMEAYFIYSNGSALTEAEVGIILSASEHVLVLSGLGLVAVVSMHILSILLISISIKGPCIILHCN